MKPILTSTFLGAMLALATTIWLGVVLFVAGEVGKSAVVRTRVPPRWPWYAWVSGWMLCVTHVLIAFGTRYGWSQEAAIRATAAQTRAVYGLDWGGGVYVNYALLVVWMAEIVWWRVRPQSYFNRPRPLTAGIRLFYVVMLANAAVVFVPGSRRVVGIALIAALLLAWWTGPGRQHVAPR